MTVAVVLPTKWFPPLLKFYTVAKRNTSSPVLNDKESVVPVFALILALVPVPIFATKYAYDGSDDY